MYTDHLYVYDTDVQTYDISADFRLRLWVWANSTRFNVVTNSVLKTSSISLDSLSCLPHF